jgi:multiple sugar transport system ATP-binding protein
MAGLVLDNVSKFFSGSRRENVGAVRRLNLTVSAREFLVILGPSGCGKTTTLRLIAGLETPDEGSLSLNGKPLAGVAPRDRDVAMVFQNHALLPHLTVAENLAFGLMLRRMPREQIKQRVGAAAEMLGLTPLLERKPPALSGGECQRVALGRALARDPQIFLFDEPLSNVDAPLRMQLRGEIAAVRRRVGAIMLYVTHDQAEAMAMADRVAVMKDGALQQVAAPLEVYHRPANRFVAGFLGSPPMNFFQGVVDRVEGAIVFHADAGFAPPVCAAAAKSLEARLGQTVTLGLRPEHFAEGAEVTALAERVEATGTETLVYCIRNGVCFISRMRAGCDVHCGQHVRLRLEMEHAVFFDAATGEVIALPP